jgi:hypothetical protein
VGSGLVMDVVHTTHELEEVVTCKSHRKGTTALQEREQVGTRAVLQDNVRYVFPCV